MPRLFFCSPSQTPVWDGTGFETPFQRETEFRSRLLSQTEFGKENVVMLNFSKIKNPPILLKVTAGKIELIFMSIIIN